MNNLETTTLAKVTKRLVPFLILCYFVAYLDRVNVGFAALTMNKDLGSVRLGLRLRRRHLLPRLFPLRSAVEPVPRARRRAQMDRAHHVHLGHALRRAWRSSIARRTSSFYLVRVLLGVAEAGFFPGIIFYLTLWFPAVYRARIVGYFMAAIPLSTVIGAPISGLLLGLRRRAWALRAGSGCSSSRRCRRWCSSVFVFFYLTDRPADATWLAPDERQWLAARLRAGAAATRNGARVHVGQAMINPQVIALSLVYFGAVATNYGLELLPAADRQRRSACRTFRPGSCPPLPYVGGHHRHRAGGASVRIARLERRFHRRFRCSLRPPGIAVSTALDDPTLKMIAFCVAGFGIFACLPVFWTLPTAFLSGAAAAGGIAVINSIGNLAGFAGPFAMGRIKDRPAATPAACCCWRRLGIIAGGIVLSLHHDAALERAPAPASK